MSTVINKAKLQYRRALGAEVGIIIILTFVLFLWPKENVSISFLVGCLSSFLPHCVFVYWVFFRNSVKDRTKMTAFYQGEGIKWLITILLVVACFKLISQLEFIFFFAGYFITLLLNNVIPFVLSRRTY